MSLTKTLQLQELERNRTILGDIPQEIELDCPICKRKTHYRLKSEPWVFPNKTLALYDCAVCHDTFTEEVK